MHCTLMPYQDKAVNDTMQRLDEARQSDDPTAFILSSLTSSGKTIIATSVMENLIFGSKDYARDNTATILWLSYNLSDNKQSQRLITQTSEKLAPRLVNITSDFDEHTFKTGHIYFLNTQKIGKGTLLTGEGFRANRMSDTGELRHTIWDTIRNTIASPNHTLYLVVDEAHRGSGQYPYNKTSIVHRLIEGHTPRGQEEPVPPMPIVMGMSALPGKFKTMLESIAIHGNTKLLKDVAININDIQASGLMKDITNIKPEQRFFSDNTNTPFNEPDTIQTDTTTKESPIMSTDNTAKLCPNTTRYFLAEFTEDHATNDNITLPEAYTCHDLTNDMLLGIIQTATNELALRYCMGLTGDDRDDVADWAYMQSNHDVTAMHQSLLRGITEDILQ